MKINKKMKHHFLTIFFIIVVIISCKRDRPITQYPKKDKSQRKENLIKINKYFVKKDAEQIESYIKRRNWDMEISESGLFYMIYESGNGQKAKKNKIAHINYKLTLLDGTYCYSSDSSGVKSFIIGKGGVEAGLEEGILLLREGDKARFIMPPHLAHGLIGDENKIPARAIIIYDVEVAEISDK